MRWRCGSCCVSRWPGSRAGLRGSVLVRDSSRALSLPLSRISAATRAVHQPQQVNVRRTFDASSPAVSRSAVEPSSGSSLSSASSAAPLSSLSLSQASQSQLPGSPPFPVVCNITPDVLARVGRNLHLVPSHPLQLLKSRIEQFFQSDAGTAFTVYDSLHPRVTVQQNFDDLLVPSSHPSRRLTDTLSLHLTSSTAPCSLPCHRQFYFDSQYCLRTHTSAHQTQFLSQGVSRFLVFGDCYRRDAIDASHYPVFHQAEGVRVWKVRKGGQEAAQAASSSGWLVADLQRSLDGLVSHLFGSTVPRRWLDDCFPFTSPSLQVEAQFQGRWLELLGCGVVQPQILRRFPVAEDEEAVGWAFGLGLERLAMVLYGIPDIRLFWSEDERFLSQFRQRDGGGSSGGLRFQPFSKYPPCTKDVSFWLPEDEPTAASAFHENDLCAVIRSVAGDLVERVQLMDDFRQPGTGRRSRLYRISYRSMSHSLTNQQVNALHALVRHELSGRLKLSMR